MNFDLASYWERRYAQGRDSGEGSRGENAIAKATKVNDTIDRYQIRSLVDWGCGDGQVLQHVQQNINYVGVDVAPAILTKVSAQFPDRFFVLNQDLACNWLRADMSLSMDVLIHLVNDQDYLRYLNRIFDCAQKLVLIYSTNYQGGRTARHVRRRKFTVDVQIRYPGWRLVDFTVHEDPEQAGFYLYTRRQP